MSDGLTEMYAEEQLIKPQQATLLRRSLENDDDSMPEYQQDKNNASNAFLNDIENPSHYTQGEIECIDAIRAALTPEEFRGFCKGNILKYCWREKHKQGDDSIRKLRWYANEILGDN